MAKNNGNGRVFRNFAEMKRAAAQDGYEFVRKLELPNRYLFENEDGTNRVYSSRGLVSEHTPKYHQSRRFHTPLTFQRHEGGNRSFRDFWDYREGEA